MLLMEGGTVGVFVYTLHSPCCDWIVHSLPGCVPMTAGAADTKLTMYVYLCMYRYFFGIL